MLTNSAPPVVMTCSWEAHQFDGKLMANGARYNPQAFVCATYQFEIGTVLRLTEVRNGLTVTVTVTDRPKRIYGNRLDLSPRAFSELDGLELGLCTVTATVVKNK